MNASPVVAELVRAYEPFFSVVTDGVVGWGHRVVGEEEAFDLAGIITQEVAEVYLARDIFSANARFSRLVKDVDLHHHEYDALLALFLIAPSMRNSFLLKAVRSNNAEVITKEFSKWGKVLNKPDFCAAISRLYSTGSFTE